MYIGEKWINPDINHNLNNGDFYNSKDYQHLLNICIKRVTSWVENNGDFIETLKSRYSPAAFGARQIAYAESGIGTHINKIQTLGRYAYKVELRKQVIEALTEEYTKLPEFARQTYSLYDYANGFVYEYMEMNQNEINREISAHAYKEMRKVLDCALW